MKRVPSLKWLLILLLTVPLFTIESIFAQENIEFSTEEKIFVVGDIHGAYDAITKSLQTMKLVDDGLSWSGGKNHLVSLGDMLDRGPESKKVMDLFIRLQKEADAVGGKVHVVLGNHEVMNMQGDLRYVSKEEFAAFNSEKVKVVREEKYSEFLSVYRAQDSETIRAQFDKAFPPGFFGLIEGFSLKGKYGSWLMSLPFVIKINDQVFAHGGLSSAVKGQSLAEINRDLKEQVERYLLDWEKIRKKYENSMFYPSYKQRPQIVEKLKDNRQSRRYLQQHSNLVFSRFSPTWYRGNALCHPFYESDALREILSNLGAKRLWVGHTTSEIRKPLIRLEEQLIIMDTGMLKFYYGGEPWIASFSVKEPVSLTQGLTGQSGEIHLAPNREQANPFNLSDENTEIFLKKGRVLDSKIKISESNEPISVVLEMDGHKANARFIYYDELPDTLNSDENSLKNNKSRYIHELAAYKIDRWLGIGLVPVTVEREINGIQGVLQVAIQEPISKANLVESYGDSLGFCNLDAQQNLKTVFDYLIQNTSLRPSDYVYSLYDKQIWFSDNQNAFSTSTSFGTSSRPEEAYVSPRFKKALMKLEREQLEKLKNWLHPKQIEAIWLRRERLLSEE
ncbi:metallophosphoesterase [Aliikangiella sp. G2MR2-5]|uniref:metallophosphoesterase n=1 Tax=Aliikangiella sp. G2MR2-5 TaxID=2788943 RepID=UPI0018AC56FC|nr:metallophosphoesterase [Aliikangiella sp. G2MR2-5]